MAYETMKTEAVTPHLGVKVSGITADPPGAIGAVGAITLGSSFFAGVGGSTGLAVGAQVGACAAVDAAQDVGRIASSPYKGQEPVEMLAELTAARMKTLGLKPGEVRALGVNWPRRWMTG